MPLLLMQLVPLTLRNAKAVQIDCLAPATRAVVNLTRGAERG